MNQDQEFNLGNWKFALHFGSDIVDFDANTFRQKPTVQDTLAYLREHQAELHTPLMAAVKAEYQKAWQDRDAFDPDFVDEILPPIHSDNDLARLIQPLTINIFLAEKAGLHFVGFEFTCSWDEEHGLGILMHQNKVARHGGADVALVESRAKKSKL